MKIIIDVNVLLSALIKESTTREIIVKSELDFYFPEPSLQKIRKYQGLILEKTGFSELEFLTILHTLFQFVRLIPREQILMNWNEAKSIMEAIDPEDVTFIAAALHSEDAILWSDDKHFDRQERIFTLKTHEVVALLFFQKN